MTTSIYVSITILLTVFTFIVLLITTIWTKRANRNLQQEIIYRQEAEREIKKRESQLAESQSVAKLGSADLNLITKQSNWSTETYRLFDKDPEKFIPGYDEFERLIHPDDLATMRTSFNNALESDDHVYHVKVRVINTSGRKWVLEATGKVKRDIDGKAIRMVGTAQDITEREQAKKILKKSEEKYRSFFENSSVSLWEEDYSEVIKYMNGLNDSGIKDMRSYFNDHPEEVAKCAGLAQILDVNPATLVMYEAQSKDDLIRNLNNVFTEDSMEVFKEQLISFFKGDMLFQSEGVTQTLTGRKIYIHLTVSVLSMNKMLISITDITERRQAEIALEKAHGELEQQIEKRTLELKDSHEQLLHSEKLAAIGGLSASIAHEFNNPLQGIMTVIKGVKRRAALDAEDVKLVDMAINECTRMKDLINSLQDFNRPSSGKIAPMNIHAAIDSLLMLSKKEYIIKGIVVKTHYAEDMVQIKGVADQIKQVVLNLLNNAAYACKRGDTITIITEVVGKKDIVIKIQDSGKGIKSEHISKIFDPFFSTKPKIKGTGLGLSVSYGIVKKHGGRIDVISEPGRGSTFTITLPIAGVRNA